jgi:hypothetical protein
MWTTSGNNHESFREQPNQAYISTDAFASEFYSYVVSRDSNLVSRGTLSLVLTSDPAAKAPKGRVLHGNGKKLIPGVNPMDFFPSGTGVTARTVSAKTLLTGVYDPVTGLKGFIDLSSPMFKKFDTNSPASFDLGLNGATPASSGVYVPGSLGGTSEAVSYFSPQNENLVVGSATAGYGMSVAPSSTQGFTLARSSITTLSGSASVAGSVASLVVAGLAIQTSGAANSTAVDDAITAYTTPRDSTAALNTTHNTNFPLVSATLNPNSITSATTEWTNYRNGVTAVTTAITTYNGAKNSTNLTAITTAVNAVQGLWTAYYNIAIATLAVAATATKGSPLTFTKNGANYIPTLDVGNAKAGRIDLPGNITFSNGGVNFTYTGTLTTSVEGISIVKAAAADTGVATIQSDLTTFGLIVVSSQIRTNSVVMINANSGIFATPPTQFSIEPFNGYALIKSSVASTEIVVSWAIMN